MEQAIEEDGVKEEEGEEDDDYYLEPEEDPQLQLLLPAGPGRRGRAREEKERTKLRERQRRAITARILAGLRRHGNYNLRVRADINEVIAALAREAGWVVLPDGTTFPSSSSQISSPPPLLLQLHHQQQQQQQSLARCSSPAPPLRLRGISPVAARPLRSSSLLSPPHAVPDPLLSLPPMDPQQVPDLLPPRPPERDFAGTPYVPVYVMLPLGVVDGNGEVVDADVLVGQLRVLKASGVDGVMVDCWWGNVEAHRPQEYNWTGYKRLFHMIRELKLKLQVVMSFHECGGNVGDDVSIPLPNWVTEIGRSNPDIYFTDRAGRRNTECLSWGIDKERVLQGRTAVEVYFDYMRSFRVEFDEYFEDGIISEIEIGLGACGELRYPSYPAKHGWKYPGIGEFQCYDRYLQKSLRRAAEARGHTTIWARAPDNAGHYNSEPNLTGFFCDGGDYDSYYGRFFLNWYSQVLVDHADRVLMLARLAFEGTHIAVKVSGVHWWYKTASHAAELTAGFYNPCNRDGYAPIAAVLKKHGAALNFTCVELRTMDQHEVFPEAFSDPEGLVWQVLNAAWDAGIVVASENALPCYDRDGFNKILENAKPLNDPDGRHLLGFTYLRLSKVLFERANFLEFERFVKRMHGEAVLDLQV
ncbi:beta-amylase 2, chloroplastic [Oryza brachyantha]|uniref:beta-amylase 2, chloroplastic n=1 Tax=Oryza brachyantha TaxID=4533 RepID=UPI001AD9AB00|nr:beta-amylase 2, chloroplastic [Oryza brachyantha]